MFDAISKYKTNSDADIETRKLSDSGSEFVCDIITPLMKRVHQQLKASSEIVFVDTTFHIDQTNASLTILLCASTIGALPLGAFISSGQDEKCYQAAAVNTLMCRRKYADECAIYVGNI